ncbi:MAG TPA: penicillin-binding protein 2 [Candidatus Nanoarchaeia archaeon]|nr:penicillin-binding protein 2 [Candidatus Nanoarchaeia archaeon]
MSKSKGIFGYPSEDMPLAGRLHLKRRLARHEQWAEGVMSGDASAGQIETETNKKPLIVLGITTLMVMGLLSLRLFSLQVISGQHNLALAEGNRIRQKITRAPRGVIYDRNKNVLAQNQASFDLTVIPSLLPARPEDRQALYARVANMAGLNPAEVATKTEAKGLNGTQPVLVASGVERDKALLIDQSSQDLTGFSLDVNPIRDYKDGGLLAHVMGYTARINEAELAGNQANYQPTDLIGKLGIEKSYEDVLRGTSGSEQTEVDASGRPIKLLASKPAVAGSNLGLTIDRDLEAKLAEQIQAQLDKSGAKKASGIALDPRNGEVLAAVSLPSYDNNLFSRGISQADYDKLANDPGQPLFNKAIDGSYPSGSTIKPFVASAALDEHVVTPQTIIEDKGKLEVVNQYNSAITYVFNGWEHTGLGEMNIYRAIAMSSDIYFYTVGGGFGNIRGLGIDRLASWYQKFGLGHRTGIDLPDESAGRVPTPEWKQKTVGEPWYQGDTYNVSVGQGDILVSPLQLATSLAAIANGGTLFKPHLVRQVMDEHGQVAQTIQPEIVRKNVATPQTLAIVRDAMRQTVQSGTACCFFDKQVPVPVAGKTGTAETDPGSNRKPHSWFEAYAPADNPRIVMVVLIENSGEGAEFAVPAVRETLAWYFNSGH